MFSEHFTTIIKNKYFYNIVLCSFINVNILKYSRLNCAAFLGSTFGMLNTLLQSVGNWIFRFNTDNSPTYSTSVTANSLVVSELSNNKLKEVDMHILTFPKNLENNSFAGDRFWFLGVVFQKMSILKIICALHTLNFLTHQFGQIYVILSTFGRKLNYNSILSMPEDH